MKLNYYFLIIVVIFLVFNLATGCNFTKNKALITPIVTQTPSTTVTQSNVTPTVTSSSSFIPPSTSTQTIPDQQYIWKNALNNIDYDKPELYLATGNQSSINNEYLNEIYSQIKMESNNIAGLSSIFHWKQEYFRNYSAGGKYVGKTNVNQLMKEKALRGCHDHALVLVTIFRKYGFPALMVDTAGIQWAWDYSQAKQNGFSGHVFVEVYVDNRWILIDSTSGQYVVNYDPMNPVIPMINTEESKGYYMLFKGLDPESYGITSIQKLNEHLKEFASKIESVDMKFPLYEIKLLPR